MILRLTVVADELLVDVLRRRLEELDDVSDTVRRRRLELVLVLSLEEWMLAMLVTAVPIVSELPAEVRRLPTPSEGSVKDEPVPSVELDRSEA